MDTDTGKPWDGAWQGAMGGDYIAAVELGDSTPTVRISATIKKRIASMGDGDAPGRERDRLVIYFHGSDRGWILNRTNATCIAAMFGERTGGWIGKRVTLCAELVQVGPKKEQGIRIVGSPDLEAPVMAVVKLPRRRPLQRRLVPTGNRSGTRSEVEDDDEHTPAEHARGEGL